MDIEDIAAISTDNNIIYQIFMNDLLQWSPPITTKELLQTAIIILRRKYKISPSKMNLCTAYKELIEANKIRANPILARMLITKAVRSDSGIVNISVSLPPDSFSCKYNCHFCPNEPGMPRSYLSNEDVFKRAAEVDFNTVQQVYRRFDVLKANGHPIDKIEYRVLGGTFSCYSHDITDEFVRDLYFAANTYYDSRDRVKGTIEEEQAINTTATVHVVGLGIETRPDEINLMEVVRFRRYGVTRVELGVQHTDDSLLRRVNRGHSTKHSRHAIKMLKDYGFKLELHIMADLPGATPEGDMECYRQVLRDDPDLIPDYMKDYPCLDVSFTKVKEWKEKGLWKPYAEATPDARDLINVLIYRQQITPKWVRVNRIQRDFKEVKDIPGHHIGFTSPSMKSNLAQIVKQEAESQGIYCKCIRCCEVRDEPFRPDEVQYIIATFPASGGTEYFISAEVSRPNRHLMLGFCRLRISKALEESIIPELKGATAMIRELHVYGKVIEVGSQAEKGLSQHLGIGKKLLKAAEEIAAKHNMNRIAVISGIGVRDYYRKQGYTLTGTYMIKEAEPRSYIWIIALVVIISIIIQITSPVENRHYNSL